jgi:hypothetical protein
MNTPAEVIPISRAIGNLVENLDDIRELMKYHKRITHGRTGRPHGVEVLNKSAVVLAIACWEAFVEDLAESAFRHLLSFTGDPNSMPSKVRAHLGQKLRNDENPLTVWRLAGDGWRAELETHKTAVLADTIGKLNTPRPDQVDKLFEELTGFRNLSSQWRWHGMSNAQAKERLGGLVALRGAIAHRVSATSYVRKTEVVRSVGFIQRLAAISSNRMCDHLQTVTHLQPWIKVRYGNVA